MNEVFHNYCLHNKIWCLLINNYIYRPISNPPLFSIWKLAFSFIFPSVKSTGGLIGLCPMHYLWIQFSLVFIKYINGICKVLIISIEFALRYYLGWLTTRLLYSSLFNLQILSSAGRRNKGWNYSGGFEAKNFTGIGE